MANGGLTDDIDLDGGVNFPMGTDDSITLIKTSTIFGDRWHEIARRP